jgi:hypothetical protein
VTRAAAFSNGETAQLRMVVVVELLDLNRKGELVEETLLK